jgi:hypothetical protein
MLLATISLRQTLTTLTRWLGRFKQRLVRTNDGVPSSHGGWTLRGASGFRQSAQSDFGAGDARTTEHLAPSSNVGMTAGMSSTANEPRKSKQF